MTTTQTFLRNLSFVGLAVSAIAGVSISDPPMAGEVKAYPGSKCKPNTNIYGDARYYLDLKGAIENDGSTSLHVICPAVRDTNADVTGIVYVIDGNSQDDIECKLTSVSSAGVILGESARHTDGTFTNPSPLSFTSRVTAGDAASIFFDCIIPPPKEGLSAILSYNISDYHD